MSSQGNLFGCDQPHVETEREKLATALRQLDTKLDTDCPVCDQRVKLYRRKMNANMARFLISLTQRYLEGAQQGGDFWVHYQDTEFGGRDYPYVAAWRLADTKLADDGHTRTTGYWQPTALGIDFVFGRATVPSHAYIFNNRAYGFTTEDVTIQQALGKHFNYAELMRGFGDLGRSA